MRHYEETLAPCSPIPAAARDLHLMIGLSWLGEASAAQIRRIWFGSYTPSGVGYRLRLLRQQGLLSVRYLYGGSADDRFPRRIASTWSLTNAGYVLIAEHGQAVSTYLPPRHSLLLDADIATSEVIARIIELGRSACMSGLNLLRHTLIDPQLPRPHPDALIVVRTHPATVVNTAWVPWTTDRPRATELCHRWALENDSGALAMNIMAGKALRYQQANTVAWRRQYGPFPVPLLVTTDQRRLERIVGLWRAYWPAGTWLMTTEAGLQDDSWQLHDQGTLVTCALFDAPMTPMGGPPDGQA